LSALQLSYIPAVTPNFISFTKSSNAFKYLE